jgi:hypothetical protein
MPCAGLAYSVSFENRLIDNLVKYTLHAWYNLRHSDEAEVIPKICRCTLTYSQRLLTRGELSSYHDAWSMWLVFTHSTRHGINQLDTGLSLD